ncbi:MAG: T9SS C-terminal target domain-containing protein, partial [Cryomorphaceae bacterium]
PGTGYDGQLSDFAHNAIAGVNGELEFFIVDGVIYDQDGYLISYMRVNEGASGAPHAVKGNAGVCVVPDPGNCFRYYIFSNRIDQAFPVGAYTILDMELPSTVPGNEDRLGALVFGDWDNDGNCKYLLNLGLPNGAGGNLQPSNKQDWFFAATDVNENNERFVFAQTGDGIWKLVIDENGIYASPNDPIVMSELFPTYPSQSWGGLRHELEIIRLENGNYRLGLTYPGNSAQTPYIVAVLELDSNGEYINNSGFIYPLTTSSSSFPIVKGLEFSPSGRYLFFTHHEVNSSQPAVQYIDYDLQQVFDLNVPNRLDFQYSHIEMGIDNRLYFAYSNGLAALDSVETPDVANWIPNALVFSNPASYAGYTSGTNYKAYTLPDQIDGMDYSFFPYYPHLDVTVSTTQTWTPGNNPLSNDTSLVRIREELRITSGATLTIKNMRFEFYENARVIIEPGGRLNLDSTIFTSGPCHSDMWLGVEVWGNPGAAQLPFSNQGYLHMTNNSVIEHAYIGALASRRANEFGLLDMEGGVIRAYNSRFRNNRVGVHLRDYLWTNSTGSIDPNRSYFENCDFLTNSLLNRPTVFPMYHTHLQRVAGVNHRNCSWRNTASFDDLEILQRGVGIFAFHSTFRATGQNEPYEAAHDTLPVSDNVHQCFYRLNGGVVTMGQPNHFFTVSNMEFQDNRIGAMVLGNSYETITFNNFKVPETSDDYPGNNYGAYLMNSYLFTVEENHFFGDVQNTAIAGLVVDNSCPDDAEDSDDILLENEVYRNTFSNLGIGLLVLNDNRDQNSEVGLQARCNVFESNYYADISLADYSEWRNNQGELNPPEAATNNLFSQGTFNCAGIYRDVFVSDLYGANQSPNALTIDYHTFENPDVTKPWAHSLNPDPQCAQPSLILYDVISGTLDYETHCRSNFNVGGGGKYGLASIQEKQLLAEQNLASAKLLYDATIDGGDTEDIIHLLQNILNEESAYLRDLLMARYPLSRDALMAAIDAAASFDPWHLTQVLIANSRLPGDVYAFLKDNQILSPFFMQFVDDAQLNGNVSLARLLDSEISLRSYEKSQAERDLHRYFLHHADSLDATEWNTYLNSRSETYYKLYRLGQHLDLGQTGAAENLLDSLPINSEKKDWLQFKINLANADTVTEGDFDTAWDHFYNNTPARGDVWGWLTAHGQLDSIPPIPEVVTLRRQSANKHVDNKPERYLQAWPNPTKDRVVLTYPKEAEGLGMVQIFNLDGQLIREFAASDAGFQEIYVTGWPAG